MATTNTPTNQKYLSISFALADGDSGIDFLTLPIKPEELTRAEPSRVSVVNSLDGAWVDSFGRGLTNLTISGNTGWRNRNGVGDGVYQFELLRDQFIHAWHNLRADKIAQGKNPSEIRLIFIDPLNGNYVADVVPTNFTLRRSKSQPLLLMYNITLVAVKDKADNPYPDLIESIYPIIDKDAAITSMGGAMGVLAKVQQSIKGVMSTIGGLAAAVNNWTKAVFGPVMALANEIIKTANSIKGAISAAGQIVVNLAADLSAVGVKLWAAVASVASIPNAIRSQIMQIKSAFSNLRCVLKNGFSDAMKVYDPSDLYGTSNCSSTTSGRPSSAFAGVNTFEVASAVGTSTLAFVSSKAAQAIDAIKQSDPLDPINSAQMADQVRAMDEGVAVYA